MTLKLKKNCNLDGLKRPYLKIFFLSLYYIFGACQCQLLNLGINPLGSTKFLSIYIGFPRCENFIS